MTEAQAEKAPMFMTTGFSYDQAKLAPLGWTGPVVVEPVDQHVLPAVVLGPTTIEAGECCLVRFLGPDGEWRMGNLPLGRNPEAPTSPFWLAYPMFDRPATTPVAAAQTPSPGLPPDQVQAMRREDPPPPASSAPSTPTPMPATTDGAPSGTPTPAATEAPPVAGDVAASGQPHHA